MHSIQNAISLHAEALAVGHGTNGRVGNGVKLVVRELTVRLHADVGSLVAGTVAVVGATERSNAESIWVVSIKLQHVTHHAR